MNNMTVDLVNITQDIVSNTSLALASIIANVRTPPPPPPFSPVLVAHAAALSPPRPHVGCVRDSLLPWSLPPMPRTLHAELS